MSDARTVASNVWTFTKRDGATLSYTVLGDGGSPPAQERLVPLALELGGCPGVGLGAVFKQIERHRDDVTDLCDRSGNEIDLAFSRLALPGDPFLLPLEQIKGDCPGIVGVQELLTLPVKLRQP